MRINSILLSSTFLLVGLSVKSQDLKKQEDIKAIKSMCGCYEVKFNFAETFQYSKDSINYKPSKVKHDLGLEWVELVEDKSNKIVLQHLLIVGKTDADIVKHWRQDWQYENTDIYDFVKDRTWKFEKLQAKNVKGQWTQKVYQVDDSPRYEGTASWVHVDGTTYWRNTTDAPLPRREHTKRDDYNVLKRRNIHEITKKGWIHEQDNDKIIRDDNGNDVLLAQEKGVDVYTKVDDSKCQVAKNFWKSNNALWQKVRLKWEIEFKKNKDLSLQKSVDGKPLYTHLFELKPDASQAEVDKIIDSFLIK
ncbi:DUF6607 family protein [Flavobacterium sp.]|uniref:DUF6607 family protein n=1 Tax=Flavobacterium sp. TaxID=239 RepID=UPI003752D125